MAYEKNKFGIVYDLDCSCCRVLNESLMHYRENDIDSYGEIKNLQAENEKLKKGVIICGGGTVEEMTQIVEENNRLKKQRSQCYYNDGPGCQHVNLSPNAKGK